MSESAPRISPKVQGTALAAVEALYNRPQQSAEPEEIVDAVTAAILPLLCGGLEEELDRLARETGWEPNQQRRGGLPGEAATPVDHALEQFSDLGEELRKAEQELEQVEKDRDEWRDGAHREYKRVDELKAKLSQVREEVERLEDEGAHVSTEDLRERFLAILDSSSSGDESSGVGLGELTVSLSREAMLGFLGHGHPHSAAWFSELVAAFETATGKMVKPNPEQAIRLTYEEAAEKLRSDEAMHTLYAYAPVLTSDNDGGPTPEEEEQLRPALEALAALFCQPATTQKPQDEEER